jgi:pimeloyl-ACP methyl ester carboxylesterase
VSWLGPSGTAALAVALVSLAGVPSAVAANTPSSAAATSSGRRASGRSTTTVWLCRPGTAHDPCAYPPTVTAVRADGTRSAASFPPAASPSAASAFDCFYVYPTVSQEKTANTGLAVRKAEIGAAVDQASPFSGVCSVWAPMYRSATSSSISRGLGGDRSLLRSTFTVAYRSLVSGWNAFLAQSGNRPIVLIGHSQGSAILIHLIATTLDRQPALRRRLVLAIIAGGNLQVPTGRTVGATFRHVPLCTRAGQTGCAIAYSSFPSQPPADSLFGRPGQGVSLQSGQTARRGEQVACVNPAALGGGTAGLDPYFLTATQTSLTPPPATNWVTYPGKYTATCRRRGGASWLQVTDVGGSGDTRPAVTQTLGPTWGYHGDDVNLALGNLVTDVAAAEASWSAQQVRSQRRPS